MSTSGAAIAAEVAKFLGDPYVYGGAGPVDFDCSGLVQYVLQQLGVSAVPRTSEQQWAWVQQISQSQLQAGDLIFSQWPGDGAAPGHVAVYVGDGNLIEAPSPGEDVHEIPFDSGYQQYVTGYGRVPGVAAGSGAAADATTTSFLNPLDDLQALTSVVQWGFTYTANFLVDAHKALSVGMRAVVWMVQPANWVRIVAGIVGAACVIAGAVFVVQAA